MGAKRELRIYVGTAGAFALWAAPTTPVARTCGAPPAEVEDAPFRPWAFGSFVHAQPAVAALAARARTDVLGLAPLGQDAPPLEPGSGNDAGATGARRGADRLVRLPSGRPLLVDGEARVAPPRAGKAWVEGPEPLVAMLDATTRRLLGEFWLGCALDEHAAVGAFARLALSLLAFGAPADLVGRTEQAALQEVEHARLCFTLASTYLGAPVEPGPLKVGGIGRNDPVDLAIESWHGGCLGEGAAAAVARAARRRAHDAAVCAVLTIISRDEAAHAELAWDVLTLCLERGGRVVADTLREAVARTPRAPEIADDDPQDALIALLGEHGWLSSADRARCAAEASRTAVRRAGWLLAPGTPSRPGMVLPRA